MLAHADEATAVPLDPDRDMLTALEQWVEQGHAPSKFIASRLGKDATTERTRLVCPYPSVAKYRGEGEEVRFATDSPVEGEGFEPSVSLKRDPDRADVFG